MKRVHPFQSRMPGHSMNFCKQWIPVYNTDANRLTNREAPRKTVCHRKTEYRT